MISTSSKENGRKLVVLFQRGTKGKKMHLIHAVLYGRDENDEVDSDEKREEAISFCIDKGNIERCREAAEGELSEDADEVNVYDLTTEEGRKKATTCLEMWEVYKAEY
jgi:hypothetical protein